MERIINHDLSVPDVAGRDVLNAIRIATRPASDELPVEPGFNERVIELMELSGTTEIELAEEFGVSLDMIRAWKSGEATPVLSARSSVISFLSQRAADI